jgi:predicted nucleic-acid-binding protein
MRASIDTNILVQYIVRLDKKSLDEILEYVKKYNEFVVTQAVFIEAIFIIEHKLGLSRNDIDKEIFCILEDQLFTFILDFDIYLFLSLYTSYKSLDVIDLYLLIHSKEVETLTLDKDLHKKIKTVKL